jgi:hypothetical protein
MQPLTDKHSRVSKSLGIIPTFPHNVDKTNCADREERCFISAIFRGNADRTLD